MSLSSPAPTVERDRWGRPLIIPPDGGKPAPYTRATTVAGTLDDLNGLMSWKCRMTAIGIVDRPDLQVAISSNRDDKQHVNRIVAQAMDAAAAGAAATTGTALHSFTEQIDRGEEPEHVPPAFAPDLDAYREATATLTHLHIEQMSVLDDLHIAGTPDRIAEYQGDLVVADVKGLSLDTPIPTPTGWTTMGDIRTGDEVFAADGSVCQVVVKSPVKQIGTYVVTFDDGSKVVCDTEHIWWTNSGQQGGGTPTPKPIEEVIRTLRSPRGQAWHRVPVAGALDLPEADLTIDPYLLGCWLGDGHHTRPLITKGRDLFSILESDGVQMGKEQFDKRTPHVITRTITNRLHKHTGSFRSQLDEIGVLGNKHIPENYLRASTHQRLRLLQGLMDTDGTWNTPRRRAAFTSTSKRLAEGVNELLLTLGQRPHIAEVNAHGFGKDVTAYHVEFTPDGIAPFRLPRKAEKVDLGDKSMARSRRRLIVSVEPGPDVPTACIGVDSADHTYLCGHQMIPTHNTGSIDYPGKIAAQLAVYAHAQRYDIATGERTPWADRPVDQTKALIIHLPAGKGVCSLHWVDIAAGWEAVQRAMWVRDWRTKQRSLTKIIHNPTQTQGDLLTEAINNAQAVEVLNELWTKHSGIWQPAHTEAAAARKKALVAAR